jgi:hypothetical protein
MTLYNVKIKRVEHAIVQYAIQYKCTQEILEIILKKHIKINPYKKYFLRPNVLVNVDNFWSIYNPLATNIFSSTESTFVKEFPIHFKILKNEPKFMNTMIYSKSQIDILNLCDKANDTVLLSKRDMDFLVFWESYCQPYTKRHYHMLNITGL